ncbi:MAG: carbohydrate kinase family protein [Clostridia bacterium]|nr:carbohydrate kinase family protein [Clostridia bacterium]
MGRVLVLGSTCVDVIIQLDHLPVTEEDMHPHHQSFRIGGCAYNVADVLGLAGADVTFVTPVGMKGMFGPFVDRELRGKPWVHPVLLEDQENGCCYCLVEKDGERTFLSLHGAEYLFDGAWIQGEGLENLRPDYTYVCGLEVEERTGDELIRFLETHPCGQVFYAPGPRGSRISQERTCRMLKLHPILHLSEREAAEMGHMPSLRESMQALQDMTENTVIATMGHEGAMILEKGAFTHVPGYPAEHVVDTIGAGDAHAGGVLAGLSKGMSMAEAVEAANRISSMVVQVEGASLHGQDLRGFFR